MKHRCHAIISITLCAAFLFYKYILQNFPSVMSQQLMTAFHLQGLGLGMLSGAYFWTYLIVPLFVGIILDRFGVRWGTSAAILCCALGMYIFYGAQSLSIAAWSRALVGVGVSFATVAFFKLASILFDKKYYALLTSYLVVSGMLGAICGQAPLTWLMAQVGWRDSLWWMSMLGVLLALAFAGLVKDKSEHVAIEPHDSNNIWQEMLQIFKSKQNWLLTGYSGLAFSPIVIFCGLWGNPFLQKAHQLNALKASSMVSMVFVGLAIASPVFAKLSEYVKNRLAFMMYSTFVSAISLALVIFIHPLPTWLVGVLLFNFGFFLGAFPLVFVIGKESNPLYLVGTAIAFINASDAFFDAVTEPLIGTLLDSLNTSSDFSVSSYVLVLSILPLYQIVAALLLKGVKDPSSA